MGYYLSPNKHLEIITDHSIYTLGEEAGADSDDKVIRDLIMFILETSLLSSGFGLDDPQVHAGKIHRMTKLGFDEVSPATTDFKFNSVFEADDILSCMEVD